MNSRILGVTVTCAALLVSACKSNATTSEAADAGAAGTAASAPSGPATPVASSTASAPAPSGSGPQSPLAIPGATAQTLPNMGIPERFSIEAKARPQGIKPTAEDVYAALKTAGLEVENVRQHLAAPQGARYCLGARAVGPNKELLLDLSACEYNTAEIARIGRDYSAETMKTIPNRTVYVNKQTTLIVREDKKTPENDALVEKAAAAFAKL